MYQFSCSFVNKNVDTSDLDAACAIDYMCLTKFYGRLRSHLESSQQTYRHVLELFFELIDHQIHSNSLPIDFQKSVVRGLTMLFLLPELENFDCFSLFEKAVQLLKFFTEELKKSPNPHDNQFVINLLSKCLSK